MSSTKPQKNTQDSMTHNNLYITTDCCNGYYYKILNPKLAIHCSQPKLQ